MGRLGSDVFMARKSCKGTGATKKQMMSSMTSDGYFKTGDVAQLDKFGIIHIVDRKKDMILFRGLTFFQMRLKILQPTWKGF